LISMWQRIYPCERGDVGMSNINKFSEWGVRA